MAAELVTAATSEKLVEIDWTKNIAICELVAHDNRQARDVVKAIKKRLRSENPNTQLCAVMLLEMLMNNTEDHIHKQVIDTGIIPLLVKIAKKKSDLPVRERIFLLLDAAQTSFGGASGKFPQYYTAYCDLVRAGVQFPQRVHMVQSKTVPESSIIQKASNALKVLKEVLDAVDAQNSQGDEFTLDLVEQCSIQKQRVMHLVMTSRDERIVSRAIELNEQLQKVLTRHDEMLSRRAPTMANHNDQQIINVFLQLDAAQTSLGGAYGKLPQYDDDDAYLVRARVQFPQRIQVVQSNPPISQPDRTNNAPNREQTLPTHGGAQKVDSNTVSESSIIQKASNALQVLKEVLDAVDAQNSQGARDEFTLDLVGQCSFQKQRVMHLVMTSRDERIVSRAMELNEQLQKVLARHDDMLSRTAPTTANHIDHEEEEEEEEEEEPEQLFRRLRKGKARAMPEDEEIETEFPRLGLLEVEERLNRSLIRPLSLEPSRQANTHCPTHVVIPSSSARQNGELSLAAIPPPPAKHIEREIFFSRKIRRMVP